ncbi:MAG: GMC family oxidoreductase N-terminal domain-containing protein, partial [Beijerinckiaceae bacterium]|nr:GMC family oxidoreductase N-terminal domain-containing protein [Beijerinckiaceae bacterium]
MNQISLPIEKIKAQYDVVVIGSGYGGGIAASRLARAGKRVCVLERGREILPGEYPSTKHDFINEVQTDLPAKHLGSGTALFDIRYNDDINVLQGCGLGGTSLIGSGVCLRADSLVFEDQVWPAEIRSQALEPYYHHAEDMLRPARYPEHFPRLAKLDALEKSAKHLGAEFSRVPILTNFEEFAGEANHVGVVQYPCVGCGDCESGCNYHAKNTVLMNYLPDAANHGAEIFTQAGVRCVERMGDFWRVRFRRMDDGQPSEQLVSADIAILAAGSLGSTEILLRS